MAAFLSIDPSEYGVDMDPGDFRECCVEEFNLYTMGRMTLDEVLLRPRVAVHFCDSIRQKFKWFDMPDDILLRSVMARRKNPVRV